MWVLLILSVMAMSNLASVRVQRHIAHNITVHSQAEHIADAGIYQAIQYLSQPMVAGVTSTPKQQFEVEFANRKINISIEDERGKIDINTATEDLIAGLLTFHKIKPEYALQIGERIKQLRKNKTEKIFKSKEQFVNLSPYISKKYNCIESYITVYSGLTSIEQKVSQNDVIEFLKWADINRWNSKRWFVNSSNSKSSNSVMRPSSSYSGYAFTVNARVEITSETNLTRSAVIRFTGDRESPFWVHEWKTDNSIFKNKSSKNNQENICQK